MNTSNSCKHSIYIYFNLSNKMTKVEQISLVKTEQVQILWANYSVGFLASYFLTITNISKFSKISFFSDAFNVFVFAIYQDVHKYVQSKLCLVCLKLLTIFAIFSNFLKLTLPPFRLSLSFQVLTPTPSPLLQFYYNSFSQRIMVADICTIFKGGSSDVKKVGGIQKKWVPDYYLIIFVTILNKINKIPTKVS